MDLLHNCRATFTKAVVRQRLLHGPFVLIDVGVQGGIPPRWRHLGEFLHVHGFDAFEEAIGPLSGKNHRYYAMALGDEDGERQLFVAAEPTSNSFYGHTASSYDIGDDVGRCVEQRTVPIRRLDSLLAEGAFARADVLKVDTEGFEPEVLKGAGNLLQTVLAVEVETNFNTSPVLPDSHFLAVYRSLPREFTVQDMAFNRVPKSSFVKAGGRQTRARPATFNMLFARPPRDDDEALRLAIIFEVYGMLDSAYDLLPDHPLAHMLLRRYRLLGSRLSSRICGWKSRMFGRV